MTYGNHSETYFNKNYTLNMYFHIGLIEALRV